MPIKSVRILLLASAALSPGSSLAQSGPALGSDAARGQRLFLADGCYECHGTVGQGGVGPRLAPSPPTVLGLAAYIRNPSGQMPPFTTAVLSDADVRDIHAYLASIPQPKPTQDLPDLR